MLTTRRSAGSGPTFEPPTAQLNVYNAVVVPCIIGIGIDNAIHIHRAYDRAGRGSLAATTVVLPATLRLREKSAR